MNNKEIPIELDQKELANLYVKGQYDQMTVFFIKILTYFRLNPYFSLNFATENYINTFVGNFLFYLSKPDYLLKVEDAKILIFISPVITNMVALSDFKTTDHWLKIILGQKENYLKLLVLYNCRNKIKLDRKLLFDINPELATLWYGIYFATSMSWQTATIFENMREHLDFWDDRMVLNSEGISYGYMVSTYINPERDRIYKNNFNNLVKKYFKDISIINNPNRKKIALISASWIENHVVYRNFHDLVETLKDDYDLTLVRLLLSEENDNSAVPEAHWFKDIRQVKLVYGEFLDFAAVSQNDFIMALYLDVGMEPVSRFLSNIRLAPIQVMNYGHPVSTFGSEIDYFIGGMDSEISDADNYYSERLILTPGTGVKIAAPLAHKVAEKKKQTERFVINCTWSSHKITRPMLEVLSEIIGKSEKKLIFRFFPSVHTISNYFLPLKQDIERILGKENVEVFPQLRIDLYQEACTECDLAIDSHPFGGLNSIVDYLIVNKPVISWEGWQFYNRLGSVILRKLGLDELVAVNREQYIDKIISFIHDDHLRQETIDKIKQIDLPAEFAKLTDIPSFKRAIDYLIENDEKLKQETDKKPIKLK
jgi:predicted O-linked N-acetylglucosamine transferase (SPINDLY family)